MTDDTNAWMTCGRCGQGTLVSADLPALGKRLILAAAIGAGAFAGIYLLDILRGAVLTLRQLAAMAIGFSLVNYILESSPYRCSACGVSSYLVWWGRHKRLEIRNMCGTQLLAIILVIVLADILF